MSSRRSQITMSPDEIDEFLAVPRTLNVATIGPDGRPHLVAMWFGFIGGDRLSTGQIAFWTFGKSQKVLNLRRDPRMTCLVESGQRYEELIGVELVGTARLVEDHDTIVAIAVATAQRHGGPVSESARQFMELQARKRIGVVLDLERIVTWDHRKLGGVY